MQTCDRNNTSVGDTVRCVDAYFSDVPKSLTIGKEYKVKFTSTFLGVIADDGEERGFAWERFEPTKNYIINTPESGTFITSEVINPVALCVPSDSGWKDTNPKDAVGTKKVPFSVIPLPVLAEVGVGMLEGARKYGRHNYRISAVRASVYFDATLRHLTSWFEGEDIDPDSGLSHVTKAITSLVVLRDAMIQSKLVDDRPPPSPEGWLKALQPTVDNIFERHPVAVPAYTNESTR